MKQKKTSVRTAGIPAEIRTEYLLNMKLERYSYVPLGPSSYVVPLGPSSYVLGIFINQNRGNGQ
jgi:hypothetical protein